MENKILAGVSIAGVFVLCFLFGLVFYKLYSDERWVKTNQYQVGDSVVHKISGDTFIVVDEDGEKRCYIASNGKVVIEIREFEIKGKDVRDE